MREKLPLVVSIRLQDVTMTLLSACMLFHINGYNQLVLSLLISAYMTVPVTHLYTQLSACSLPNGWIRHVNWQDDMHTCTID